MTYHLGLGRRLRLYTLSRERLLFDSRFVPPYAGSPENQTVLYALLRGELVWRAPHEHLRGPALLRLRLGVLHGELADHAAVHLTAASGIGQVRRHDVVPCDQRNDDLLVQ